MSASPPTRARFVVGPDDQGKRLDQVLAANVPGLSRRQARALLDIGGVFVDGSRTKVAGRAMRAGQTVVANIGGGLRRATKDVGEAARARDIAALPPYSIVHQDPEIVVVDKPSGLLTAPTPEGDANTLQTLLQRALGGEIYIVQRLDLETSGLLVLPRTKEANRVLSERIREHNFERVYLAVVEGEASFNEITVNAPLHGKRAVTRFKVIERLPGPLTLLECSLETGRTHQIRLHAQGLGHPVLGDRRYGSARPDGPPRLALHAARLGFIHPKTGESLTFTSPLPNDLATWLDALRRSGREL